ncbi:hypothetical protein HS7_15320 [Sulfolobales archaeon HS-7]|nr:hypothetical protein HS7_15320 [Sulfolobales archaeon HS-7]
MRKIEITKHVSYEQLLKLYSKEDSGKLKLRLLIIVMLYEGRTEVEISSSIKVSRPTIRKWLKRWNTQGYKGLTDKPRERKIPKGSK